MKEAGHEHWNYYDDQISSEATNESGFTVLPAGYRFDDGNYYNMGNNGNFWSSSEFSISGAWRRELDYENSGVYRYYSDKQGGFSIRCLRDD